MGERLNPTAHLCDPERITKKKQKKQLVLNHTTTWRQNTLHAGDVITTSQTHLDHHLEAVIERSPQNEITRGSNQEFIPLPLWYSSDGPILIWDLSAHTPHTWSLNNVILESNSSSVTNLDVTVGSQFVVPQDDFSVFPSASQHTSAPHLTHAEHTSLMTFDLATDLKCWIHKCTGESILYPNFITVLISCLHILWVPQQAAVLPRGLLPVGVSAEFRVHTSRTPPESPVRMSPVLRKTRHWTNFGFSYFYTTRNTNTTRNRVRKLLGVLEPVTCSSEVSAKFLVGMLTDPIIIGYYI